MPRKKGRAPAKRTGSYKRGHKKQQPGFLRWCVKWLFILGMWASIAGFVLFLYYAHDLPDLDALEQVKRTPGITLLDKNGELITRIGSLYGKETLYDAFPGTLIDAVVATEDRRFFHHFGIDLWGILRALVVNVQAGRVVQGGSTITQQLAKISFLTHDRTIKRKIQELLLALYLEKNFTKQQILALYLNRVYLGAGNYGVSAAAKFYFNKPVEALDLYESAILAGLIRAPSRYAPSSNPELAKGRAEQVLKNMVHDGLLKYASALPNSYLQRSYTIKGQSNQRIAPYFVDWVIEQLPDYVGSLEQDVTLRTTLDPSLQHMAEAALDERLSVSGEKHNVSQGAMVVLSPEGEVLAMVGGKDYSASQFNRATQAQRQPGSAFKLFVYATAFDEGYTPEEQMQDAPLEIEGWAPKNYDKTYRGDISLKEAFAFSVNTVAVKLASEVGIDNVIRMAHRLGISSEIKRNLASVLGASETNLLELTGAFSHFANRGNAVWVHGITSITAMDGTSLYERDVPTPQRILKPETVADMNQVMKEVVNNGTGKQARISHEAAGKTGTSQDARDAWFIGFTDYYVAGVWYGNDNNSPMKQVGGGGLPALTWHDFMQAAHGGKTNHALPITTEEMLKTPEERTMPGSFWKDFFSTIEDSNVEEKVDVEYDYPSERRR